MEAVEGHSAPKLFRVSFCRPPPNKVVLDQYFPLVIDVVNEYGESYIHLLDNCSLVDACVDVVNPKDAPHNAALECQARTRSDRGKQPIQKKKRHEKPEHTHPDIGNRVRLPSSGPSTLEVSIRLKKAKPLANDAVLMAQLRIYLVTAATTSQEALCTIADIADLTKHKSSPASVSCVLPLYSVPFHLASIDVGPDSQSQQYCERHIGWRAEEEPIILRERIAFSELGGRIWTGALVLSTYLRSELQKGKTLLSGSVIELGSGCGLVGIAAALLSESVVTLTDLGGPVLELLQANTMANGCAAKDRLLACELDWEDPISDLVLSRGPFACILVADCTYNESVYGLLADVIARLSNSGTKIFISHTVRSHYEQEVLMDVCVQKGFSFEIVWNVGDLYFVYCLAHKQKGTEDK